MTPEQWQKVFAIVKDSQSRAADQRASFLAARCANDEEVLRAAQALLVAEHKMGSFLESPAAPSASMGETFAKTEQVEARLQQETLSTQLKERPALSRGATLGRYVVLDLLGTGGMGVVYAAYDPELDRKVALKLLHTANSEPLRDTDGKARLLREAKAMARLSHPNVITVHDVGTIGDEIFVAMEYVEGGTLRQWLGAHAGKWREIVDMFVQAGRGLSAAHSAGIVHRDFKPDNVLVGKDGRARVLDFGLARGTIAPEAANTVQIVGEGQRARAIGPMALADEVTKAGTLVGTPAYMAPEQLTGGKSDERTDQFSFCVALYEALYGETPFEGDTVRDRVVAIQQGRLRSPKASARVPSWLREVVTRGLHGNPEARHPSMDVLLSQLQRNPSRSRNRLLGSAAVLTLVSLAAWGAYRFEHNRRLVCRGAEDKLASAWGDDQKRALSTAFLATGLPYAADAVRGVNRLLDDYARRWIAMETETCEATRLRGEQSEELLDLRMSCLAQRREELRSLARIFASADKKVVQKSVTAAQGLSEIESCGDVQALKAPVKPPADIRVRAKVEDVRLKLSEVRPLGEAGKYAEALSVLKQAARDAEAIAYRPLEAETLIALSTGLKKAGEFRQAEETGLKGTLIAESAKHDEAAARGWGQLIGFSEARANYESAELWAKLAFAAIERMGGNDALLCTALINLGVVYDHTGRYDQALDSYRRALGSAERLGDVRRMAMASNNSAIVFARQGKYDNARPQFERSLVLMEQALGTQHPDLGPILINIGEALRKQKKYEQALAHLQRSLQIRERSLGPDHPLLAQELQGIGSLYYVQGNMDEAMRYFQRARDRNQKAVGENHPRFADNLIGMGQAYLGQGQPAEAIPLLERGLDIYSSKEEVDALWIGEAQFALARALNQLRRDPRRARALAEQAQQSFSKSGEADKSQQLEVQNWLAKNFPQEKRQ